MTKKVDLTPIPTRFKGIEYRSKLEACWAAFFDHLGVRYEYEMEAFDVNGRNYLPDFYLPGIRGGVWVEIKPRMVEDVQVYIDLAKLTGDIVYLICCSPSTMVNSDGESPSIGKLFFPDEVYNYWSAFCICTSCGAIDIEDGGVCMCDNGCQPSYEPSHNHYFLEQAAIAAHKSVRWEPMKAANDKWASRSTSGIDK